MVGVCRFPSCAGTYLLIGCCAFLECAHAKYFGIANMVSMNAMTKATPARTEIYPNRLISKSCESSYNINFKVPFIF